MAANLLWWVAVKFWKCNAITRKGWGTARPGLGGGSISTCFRRISPNRGKISPPLSDRRCVYGRPVETRTTWRTLSKFTTTTDTPFEFRKYVLVGYVLGYVSSCGCSYVVVGAETIGNVCPFMCLFSRFVFAPPLWRGVRFQDGLSTMQTFPRQSCKSKASQQCPTFPTERARRWERSRVQNMPINKLSSLSIWNIMAGHYVNCVFWR